MNDSLSPVRLRLRLAITLVIGAWCGGGIARAEGPRVAFLAAEPSLEQMGPHNRGGWETAKLLPNTTLLLRQADGTFADPSGTRRKLTEFEVVWHHQGDAIARTAMYGGPSLAAIRQFAEDGGGVLLTGGALALVASLGLEADSRPQRRDLDNFRDPAGMVLVEHRHPVFQGLTSDGGVIWLSGGGCRAVADFYWGGPTEGMILATTPDGPQNPLVEYSLGKGRVIVFGWRWPDYADLANPHRGNLLRLTTNLLTYLRDASAWRPVVIRSEYPPVASPEEPGVSRQQWRALRMAIEDLVANSPPGRYPNGPQFLARLEALFARQSSLSSQTGADYAEVIQQFQVLQRDALLANPLLDFDTLLMIRRRADQLGLPLNFHGNSDLEPTGYENDLVALTLTDGRVQPGVKSVFRPDGDRFIGDLEPHYDGDRLLMSIPDSRGKWGIAELHLADGRLTPIPLIEDADVHNYDACYLPDGRIVFSSTAPTIGVPCVGGRSKVANLYRREPDGAIRRLTNDQDHNWCPTVLNDGQLMYQRWEYADIAHAFTRLLFQAWPDGTQQRELYGGNSFWPTAMFFARPIPDQPTKFVAIVGGHHEAPRQGELVLFDTAKGRYEASGVVQRIPGYGKEVKPVILDGLIGAIWPRFLHPYPLSDKYFLVSCKPTKTSLWGVYLVDVFDNFVLLYEEPGRAILEPTPVRKTRRPPQLPDTIRPERRDGSVLLLDVYVGGGLRGVPRGAVKSLRVFGYEFTLHGFGGEPYRVGFDGPWDVKRILGTVPVEADGSAHFVVPANTPVSVQPLDGDGKALALMRSWFTAMPGETVSCLGCHQSKNQAPTAEGVPVAALREPSAIKPWYGPARGFAFAREVQPVLDAYCVGCHHGRPLDNGQIAFDLTARPPEKVASAFQMRFTPAYTELRRFVNTPTLESDAHMLPPRDFHADTSRLVQILRDGHYGVELNGEAWDRIITWIDLNAPAHGTWNEVVGHVPGVGEMVAEGARRRRELHLRYAGIDEDPETVYPAAVMTPVPPKPLPKLIPQPSGQSAEPPRTDALPASPLRIELAPGIDLELARIEAGKFIMGAEDGYPNERPAHLVTVDAPFWMGRFEITNRQFACFHPEHDSGLETGEQYQFGDDERGHRLSRPDQPVVRVSWDEAMAFCRWLSDKTGRRVTLPTEEQWEYACRAGSRTDFWYGTLDSDFSRVANLSDATHHTVDYPHVPTALPPWRPADTRFDDRWRVSAPPGTFAPNAWGLCDMHGNVAEWTRSAYGPYPGAPEVSREAAAERKTVRGGSWLDWPRRARSAFRLHYSASQGVHDVGFRVVVEETGR